MNSTIKVLKTGDGWIGIEKPCGISVHNDPGNDVLSILTEMINNDHTDLTDVRAGWDIKIQPVHRLDKDTSGVLLLAYTHDALSKLSKCFHQGIVHKKYIALVHGNFDDHGENIKKWNFPLSKDAGGRNNPAGKGKKVKAITHFKILKESQHYAMLEIKLITGRKHQIRRHAKIAGHPVTSDKRYGSKKSIQFLKDNCGYNRLGLHAKSIEIKTMEPPLLVTSKNIPTAMVELIIKDDLKVAEI